MEVYILTFIGSALFIAVNILMIMFTIWKIQAEATLFFFFFNFL
jgi:hypothetical protein